MDVNEISTSVRELIQEAKRSGLMQASIIVLRTAESFEGETKQVLLDLSHKLVAMSEDKCESHAKE